MICSVIKQNRKMSGQMKDNCMVGQTPIITLAPYAAQIYQPAKENDAVTGNKAVTIGIIPMSRSCN